MERSQFSDFSDNLKRLGAGGLGAREFVLGRQGNIELRYIPFEHVNREARLVIVGITPGNNQMKLAYGRAQELLKAGWSESDTLQEVKKTGAFGGPSMKPNLLKILRYFNFNKLLGVDDVESLWAENAHLLHSTSVVPHAAFRAGKMFSGSFREVLDSPLLAGCFMDCFVPSVREMAPDALYVGLGPCPKGALEWCVQKGLIRREQLLGAFCHPARSGGSSTRYYLREVSRGELDANDPVRNRCDWLDEAYAQMRINMAALVGGNPPHVVEPQAMAPVSAVHHRMAKPPPTSKTKRPTTSTPAKEYVARLILEIQKAGYRCSKEIDKVAEFEAPAGQVIYLVKTTSRLNSINLMVHPALQKDELLRIDGVESVSAEHRFHSNMTRFPKRIKGGETATAYGWQVNIRGTTNLSRFLEVFKKVRL